MTTWSELPSDVRETVQAHVGPVAHAVANTEGQNNDIAAVLEVPGRTVFLKGVRGVSRRMRWLRNEARTAPLTQGFAPQVLYSADVGDWFVVVFEYVDGRPADLSPGSADLPVVAETVDRISVVSAEGPTPLRKRWGVTDWWGKLAEADPEIVEGWDLTGVSAWSARFPELVDGNRLVHTDLHGDQFRIAPDSTVRVIDWGYPGVGAAWVDAAFLVLRLIEAGHDVDDAEEWVQRHVRCFSEATAEARTAFAVYIAGLWGYWAATGDLSGSRRRARVAREYADRRLLMQGV